MIVLYLNNIKRKEEEEKKIARITISLLSKRLVWDSQPSQEDQQYDRSVSPSVVTKTNY